MSILHLCSMRRVTCCVSLFSFLFPQSCEDLLSVLHVLVESQNCSWVARAIHILVSQRRTRCYWVLQKTVGGKEGPAINPADRQARAQLPYSRKLPRQLNLPWLTSHPTPTNCLAHQQGNNHRYNGKLWANLLFIGRAQRPSQGRVGHAPKSKMAKVVQEAI